MSAEPETFVPITLAPEHITLLKSLRSSIASTENTFACTGIIQKDLIDVTQLCLYYSKDLDTPPQRCTLPLSAEDAMKVYEAGEPSPFGKGDETVLDPEYRLAHELKPPLFALTNDLIGGTSVLSSLANHLDIKSNLKVVLHKMNIYPKGGFFKTHRDTPRGDKHIGTLTFCLPSTFTGGDLLIRQGSTQVRCEWSDQVSQDQGRIAWAFLYSDCEHEVLPVTSGNRITLAYDVYIATSPPQPDIIDTRRNLLQDHLRKLLEPSSGFMLDGGHLSFPLQHDYPLARETKSFPGGMPSHLKGMDAVLVNALKSLGLKYQGKGVYNHDYIEEEIREEYNLFENKLYASEFAREWMVADVLDCMEGWYNQDSGVIDYIEESGGAFYQNAVWVTQGSGQGGVRNDFMTYGNEAQADYTYVTVAAWVEIPPVGERKYLAEDIVALARARAQQKA